MPLSLANTESDLGAVLRKRLRVQPEPAPQPQPDTFGFLKPLSDAASNVGRAVGGAFEAAHKAPVLGGVLDALGAVGDATVGTPLGLAELGADQFLHTGLTSAAQRANAGRPIWELPKTAAGLTRGALGEIAGDASQDPAARGLAGIVGTGQDIGSLVAPIPGAGQVAGLAGKGLRLLPPALEHSIGEVAPGAGMFGSREGAIATAGRKVKKTEVPTTDTDLHDALANSLRNLGRPDLIESPVKPPSDFVKADPRLMSVHDANEQAIAAMKDIMSAPKGSEDWGAFQTALQAVTDAGGKLSHTAKRLRDAGLPTPTAGELEGMVRGKTARKAETPLAEAITKRTEAAPAGEAVTLPVAPTPAGPTGAMPSNVIPIEDIRARLVDSLTRERAAADSAALRGRLADAHSAGRRGATPPPPAPPTPPTPSVPPPAPASRLDKFLSVWNLPKALKATLDLSAPFRQGVLLSAGHPGEFFGSFKPMLHALVDSKYASTLDNEIRATARPGLYLAPLETGKLGAREEAFMSSIADKIPGVSASNRAYVTFLNKLRADVYDNVLEGWKSGGKAVTEADAKGLADVINHFTGRGDLPGVSQNTAAVLNGLFFSPRFVTSRVQSVGDALGVLKGGSLASKEAASSLAKFVGSGLAVLTLAQLAGYKVESDPRSSGFGKIQIGPHTYDIWGGEQQIPRYIAQLITGQEKPVTGKNAGKVVPVSPRGWAASAWTTAQRFGEGKFAPTTSTLADIVSGVPKNAPDGSIGTGFGNKPFSAADLLSPLSDASLTGPISLQDVIQHGAAALPGMLGVGYQYQGKDAPAPTGSAERGRVINLGGPAPAPTSAPGQTGRVIPIAPASGAPRAIPLTPPSSGGKQPSLIAPQQPTYEPPPSTPPQGDVPSTIASVAQQSGIDPRLAIAVAQIESGLNPNAIGDNGNSHGLFQENVYGRGSGRAPDYDVARQTQRFAADVQRLIASGFTGTPGELAAAAQRPADPIGYARKVDAIYGSLR